MGPSRRELLRASGAGLATLLGACRPGAAAAGTGHISGRLMPDFASTGHRLRDGIASALPSSRQSARVLVVGAGIAGLAAAWRLQRAGIDGVQVIELAPEPGGTSIGGQVAELRVPWGAHYLPVPRTSQRHLVAQLEDLGLVQGTSPTGRVQVPDEHLVRAPAERIYELGYWEEGLWPPAGDTAQDRLDRERLNRLLTAAGQRSPDGRRPFDQPLAQSSPDQRSLDGMSGADWAAANGLDSERVRWYLDYATRDDFGASLETTSAYALLHYFLSREDSAGETADFLTWPEGNGRLVEGMTALLPSPPQTGQMALRVVPGADGTEVHALDVQSGTVRAWSAERVILAVPQFVAARILADDPHAKARRTFRYSPWVVANLHLCEPPPSRGFPAAWDSVLRHSPSLGYVDATHQLDRDHARDTVWTWYLPITDLDEAAARAELMGTTWEDWRNLVLADLAPSHPGLAERVTHIDVRRWGHAMVKPVPGFVWGQSRQVAARPVGGVHFAHSDLSAMALYEEAHWQGVRAAEEVLAALGSTQESLLDDVPR